MDLDDDELWATQYSRNYVSKNKIKAKIKEYEEIRAKALRDNETAETMEEKYKASHQMAIARIKKEALEDLLEINKQKKSL